MAVAGKLSDQLGAMAIIDELRYRKMVVDEHLNLAQRRAEVAQRIGEYYEAQNISVDDGLIEQGVRAYFDRRLVFEPGPDHPGARAEALKYVASERERERNADADAGGGYPGASAVVASEPQPADPVSVWFGRLGKAWGYLKISAVCCLALGFYNN
jgi:chorismate mutase